MCGRSRHTWKLSYLMDEVAQVKWLNRAFDDLEDDGILSVDTKIGLNNAGINPAIVENQYHG